MSRSTHMLYDFTAYMNAAKDRAASRRNRGLTTGKAAKGHTRARSNHAPLERGSFAELVARTLAHWDNQRGCAIDDYLRDVFPDRYDGEILL